MDDQELKEQLFYLSDTHPELAQKLEALFVDQRAARERAEADNAAWVLGSEEVIGAIRRDLGHPETRTIQVVMQRADAVSLLDVANAKHPGAALLEETRRRKAECMRLRDELRASRAACKDGVARVLKVRAELERLRKAEQERDEWKAKAESVWRVKEDNERFAVEQERVAAEALRERDALRAQLTTTREEGRRDGLEQALGAVSAEEIYTREMDADLRSSGRFVDDARQRLTVLARVRHSLDALAAQPAQEAPRQDTACDCAQRNIACIHVARLLPEHFSTDSLFATVREGVRSLDVYGRQTEAANRAGVMRWTRDAIFTLERRMGAMARALKELADLMDAVAADAYRPDAFTTQPARLALTSAPPVFTLEEVEEAMRGIYGPEPVLRRLRERAGGKP